MLKEDNRNLILALGLSFLVIVAWNFFYGMPQMNQQRQAQQNQQQAQQPGAAQQGAPTAAPPAATLAPVSEPLPAVLARSPRVKIDTPSIAGSISLAGGRIDDVALKRYRETVDPNSPIIQLLAPSGSPHPFYAEFGWAAAPGASTPTPDANTVWTADSTTLTADKPVTLSWDNGQGLLFSRTIAVDMNAMFTITDKVENKSGAPATLANYALVSRHGTPVTSGYYILHEGLIGVIGEQGLKEVGYSAIEKSRVEQFKAATGGFLGFTDKYWAAAVIPDQASVYDARFSFAQAGAIKTYQTDLLAPPQTVEPGKSTETRTRLFAGAKEVASINDYEKSLGILKFDLMIDWGLFWFITKPLFQLIDWFFRLTGNFGIAILIVTVIVKGVFFPLANKSYASMAKMKAVQPEMVAIRERYPDDKLKQQQELMALYKKEKINPIAGCWPVLLQIPVFFALYKVIFVTIEMRHAPFFGWIKDLSAPDPTSVFNLFGLLPYQVPEFHFLHIGVWPIIMGFSMFLQMKMNPEPTDPIQKTMFSWMPVIFTFMLGTFPAGLVIYWTWNNLLSVTQQGYIMKKNGVKIELFDNLRNLFKKKTPAAKT
ncbi:MAG: membrane protein insertase YidC [Rhizobiales bacterium 65-9]|nr:membrane protein insertase YidC [Hyphomicrobiales bacterium]OJY38230.1 MAG: membrane protein insertase YidC [Rhizobiales bacterium 65-9]